MDERLPRKLAAILYADVAGYSLLTGNDEDATHRTLSEYLDLVSATIESHRGQVMHYAGDAVLARFDAVIEAVSSATDIQRQIAERNEDLPVEQKFQFRIGINLGDVIEDRGDIYGDGVNIAARLESLAESGGICISESVRTAVGKKLNLDYEDLGAQEVKNIVEPIRAYRVVIEKIHEPAIDLPLSGALELPDKPSIAVLPFTNMSADPEQEYFSDGISEDVITELSRFHSLFVIARNSSFTYKGRSVNVKEVASELGVQYVVEGSVRRVGDHVRVTAQLVEAETGNHIWAERYDRKLEDIFAVQDEIVESIVSNLEEQLAHVERDLAKRKSPSNLDAYDYLLRGRGLLDRQSKSNNQAAIEMFNQALKLSPDYALAYAYLTICYIDEWKGAWSESSDQSLAFALDCAKRAESLDDTEALGHGVLGMVHARRGEYAQSQAQFDLAISYNPNDASCLAMKGLAMTLGGSAEEGLRWIKDALRRNPLAPGWVAGALGIALYMTDQYTESILTLETKTSRFDSAEILAWLAAGYAQIGNEHKARSSAIEYIDAASAEMAGDPPTNWSDFLKSRTPFAQKKDMDHFLDGLHKAGLAE